MQVPYYYSKIKLKLTDSDGMDHYQEVTVIVESSNAELIAAMPADDPLKILVNVNYCSNDLGPFPSNPSCFDNCVGVGCNTYEIPKDGWYCWCMY